MNLIIERIKFMPKLFTKIYPIDSPLALLVPGSTLTCSERLTPRELEFLQEPKWHQAILFTEKNNNSDNKSINLNRKNIALHKIGYLFKLQSLKQENGISTFTIRIMDRIKVPKYSATAEYISGEYERYKLKNDLSMEGENSIITTIFLNLEISNRYKKKSPITTDKNGLNLKNLICELSKELSLSDTELYELIEADSLNEQALILLEHIDKDIVKNEVDKSSKKTEFIDMENPVQEQNLNYSQKIELKNLPAEAKKIAIEELSKISKMPTESREYISGATYLDFILELPWEDDEAKIISLKDAKAYLDAQHYGLADVKKRILEHIAVMVLRPEKKGANILLVGPPGVGKSTIAESIAKALSRPFEKISLGGVRDESILRGFLRTYVDSRWGGILESIRRAGTKDVVVMLDELEKTSDQNNHAISSALLEVLDPAQQNKFRDNYLNIPYDISQIMFIATANDITNIPAALLDRLEVIEVGSYTYEEKFNIAKNYLWKRILSNTGLDEKKICITDDALSSIITDFTNESGVRNLYQKLESVARFIASKIVTKEAKEATTICTKSLEEILGRKPLSISKLLPHHYTGIANGLSIYSSSGMLLPIEAVQTFGNGKLIFTGKIGDTMKESVQVALTALKCKLQMYSINFDAIDLHLHIPDASTLKDGPSAGCAIYTALASQLLGVSTERTTAMTGEITVTGAVLPVGAVEEKIRGAIRCGMKKVIIPNGNAQEVALLAEETKDIIDIIPVETVEELLRETLGAAPIALPHISASEYFEKLKVS